MSDIESFLIEAVGSPTRAPNDNIYYFLNDQPEKITSVMIIFTGVGSMSVRVGLQSEYYHIPDHVFPLATPDQRTMFQLINQSSIPKTKEGVVGFDYTAEELIEEASAVFFERAQAPQEPCIITFSKVETDTTGNSTYTPV